MNPSHEPIISEYMTASPETIESDLTLAQAAERMHVNGIRHLPVLKDGNLVGVLSQRDILVLQSVPGCDLDTCPVDQAMVVQPFTCGPKAHVRAVALEMAEHKYGTAVVVDREHPAEVLGVFTTVDALRALNKLAAR